MADKEMPGVESVASESSIAREKLLDLLRAADRKRRQAPHTIVPRESSDGLVPASFAQERLWFLDQVGLVGAAYNVPLVLRLHGNLDEEALERSFTELVRRHEILRTRFTTDGGLPRQVIEAPRPFKLFRTDLRGTGSSDERERQLRDCMQREQLHRFDLAKLPLFRVMLVRIADMEHALVLTMHHIVSDGWSVSVLVRELSALYAAYRRGESSPLNELPVQYGDYALWQRQWLQGGTLESQLKYWSDVLEGAPPELLLPTDRPRPAVESFEGATLKFELPHELLADLEELGRQESCTVFMTMLAAYQLLLARYSGQRDIVVGSPIANRRHQELEGLIGFFVNTLALRTTVTDDLTFRELLRKVRETTLGAYAHQDLPFEMLVKELRPERNLARQPIFQVMLAVQNYPEEQLELAGLTWSWSDAEFVKTHFDVTLYLYKSSGGMTGVFEYSTDLFDEISIERMATHFRTLLESAVTNPDRLCHTLSLLEPAERQRLLVDWNATAAPYPHDRSIVDLFAEHVTRTPDAPALTFADRTLTYAELNARANRLANYLMSLGVGPETIVGVHLERSIEMIVGFLGILKAGAAYLPLDPENPRERLALLLEEADVSVVLTSAHGEKALPAAIAHPICIERDVDLVNGAAVEPPRRSRWNQLAYVLYTSGSTGRPKAVGVDQRSIIRLLIGTDYIRITEEDVFLQLAAPAFDASTFEIWGALLHGAHLVLYPDADIDLQRLEQVLQEHRVTVLWLTAGLFHRVIDERPRALSSLRWLLAGGDVLSTSHVRRAIHELPGCRLINGYGPTEATTFSVCYPITDARMLETSVPIGRPIANTQAYVLDDRLQPAPTNVPGHLYIAGDGLARGYLKHPALTADRFVANPFGPRGSRMYRSGDIVRWRTNGTLEFLGRADSQVKIRGHRIEPGEIEAALLEHPAVKQALIVPQADEAGERRLVCYVVGDRGAALHSPAGHDSESLRNAVVGEWETLYEETYGEKNEVVGPSFVGWNSSYTGEAIPELQMQEWLSSTIARIQSLRPKRVLEIGCGVGLLLQHLAPECDTYVGTDFSEAALAGLKQWMRRKEQLQHVQLLHRSATDLKDLERGSFDTVILNSVVQYFPDVEYLLAVLRDSVRLIGPNGNIFIGDIRNMRSQRVFHTAVQLGKAAATVSVGQLRRRVARAISQDKELVIDPQLFHTLPGHVPGIAGVEVLLKRGKSQNELTRHRYDAILRVGGELIAQPIAEPVEWQEAFGSTENAEIALRAHRWRAAHMRAVPDRRLSREAAATSLIDTGDERQEVGAVRRQLSEMSFDDVDPQQLWDIADAQGYDITVSPGCAASFDVMLLDRTARDELSYRRPVPLERKSWAAYANDPLENGFRQQLIPQLREHLKARLPDYMMPGAWMVLKQMPLTPNGKVDRRALPAPQGRPEEMGEYVPPRTPLEQTLAEIWGQLLSVDQVGAEDNFFELGGHSLLIVQLMEKLRRVGLMTSVRSVYENPTLEALARTLTSQGADTVSMPPNAIPPNCDSITPSMLPLIELDERHIERIVHTVPGGAVNVQDIYPLAPLQEGMLFHHLLSKGGRDAYARSMLLSFSSRERLDDFTSALQRVIDRHDILRTAVIWEGMPRAVQVVHRSASLPVEELRLDRDRDPIEQLSSRMTHGQQVELSQAPMIRLLIAADANGLAWYAVVQTHHLVFDNESMQTMLSEVMAVMDGRGHEVPPPAPYRNHVAQVLMQAAKSDAEFFFRSKLAGIDGPTAPFGLIDVHGDGGSAEEVVRELKLALSKRIRTQARRLGSSAATLFHAAWALVVACTSARDDVVFGSVLLGRLQGSAGAQRILGMFINTLPLRLKLRGLTASDLIQHTQGELAELLNYEQASLALAQRCSELPASTPLFSSLLNYVRRSVDLPSEIAQTPGVSLLANQGGTNYPVLLTVYDQNEGFTLALKTGRGIDPGQMMEYVCTALHSLVSALETTPHRSALSLPVLPEQERSQITESLNNTRTAFPEDKLLHELFEEQVARTPDALAVTCSGQSLTYSELNAKANRLARYLQERGVGPDLLVGLYLERSVEIVVCMLATLKAGGAYVPLDPHNPRDRIDYLISDAAPKVLLTMEHLESSLPITTSPVISLDRDWGDIGNRDAANLDSVSRVLSSGNLAYVIYTSGSTGKPKGVMVEHRNVVNYALHVARQFDVKNGEGSLICSSFSFDLMLTGFYPTLVCGRPVRLCPESRGSETLADLLLESTNLAPLKLTPSHLSLLDGPLREGRLANRVRVLVLGGESLGMRAVEEWKKCAPGTRIFNHYGPTETTVGCIVHEVGEDRSDIAPIGRPISNTRVYILGPQMQPVPVGVAGEIYIGGAGVARGYLRRPELTAERFISDPFTGKAGDRLYKTGDLGRWRTDHTIEYLGRNDGQVKVRGHRVELGEIEAQLLKHPHVRQVTVLAREDVPGQKRLVAYVVSGITGTEAARPSPDELRAMLSAALPDYMVPDAFVSLEALPLTPNGKRNRQALPPPERDAYAIGVFETPTGYEEESLAEIWRELLRLQSVGRNDDFFTLGGHSLLATQLMVRIRQSLSVEISLRTIFEFPVLSDLARKVADLRDNLSASALAQGNGDMEALLHEVAAMSEHEVRERMRALGAGSRP